MNRKKQDYSDPIFLKKIQSENVKLYERLQHIYEEGNSKSLFKTDTLPEYALRKARQEKVSITKNLKQRKIIQEENLRLLINLTKIKATKSLSKRYLEDHWKNFLVFKSRRFLSRNVRILIANR
jgi:hypothetical protein